METKAVDLTRTMLAILSIPARSPSRSLSCDPSWGDLWGRHLVVATWPLMLRVQSAFGGRRGPAVALMSLILLCLVLLPLSMVIGRSVARQYPSRLAGHIRPSLAATAGLAVRYSACGSPRCRKVEKPDGERPGEHRPVASSLCQDCRRVVSCGRWKLRTGRAAKSHHDRHCRHSLCQG